MLQQAEAEDEPVTGLGRGVVFYFICNNADELYTEMTQRGLQLAPPEVAFYGMKQVHTKDLDGYDLCLESPVEAGPATALE